MTLRQVHGLGATTQTGTHVRDTRCLAGLLRPSLLRIMTTGTPSGPVVIHSKLRAENTSRCVTSPKAPFPLSVWALSHSGHKGAQPKVTVPRTPSTKGPKTSGLPSTMTSPRTTTHPLSRRPTNWKFPKSPIQPRPMYPRLINDQSV